MQVVKTSITTKKKNQMQMQTWKQKGKSNVNFYKFTYTEKNKDELNRIEKRVLYFVMREVRRELEREYHWSFK